MSRSRPTPHATRRAAILQSAHESIIAARGKTKVWLLAMDLSPFRCAVDGLTTRYIPQNISCGMILDPITLSSYLRDPRLAITAEGVVCLVCGHAYRHLTNTHLRGHGLTSDEYKRRFGYNVRRALMVPDVRGIHTVNAVKIGLASRIRRRPIVTDITLRRLGGRHSHALEESLTRKERLVSRSPQAWSRDSRGRFSPATKSCARR